MSAPRFDPQDTRADALRRLRATLEDGGIEAAPLEARMLLAAALAIPAVELLVRDDLALGEAGANRLAGFAERRLGREPVARILGEREFWGLPLRLSAETLVPRPDTEAVVALALDLLPERSGPVSVLDLGTGSGAILLALLHARPAATGIGTDRSLDALLTARANARALGLGDRAGFAACDWAEALGTRFDLVVSNPPYIRAAEIAALEPEVAGFDPPAALSGGPDGLDAYRAILADLPRRLVPGGRAVVEVGHDQGPEVLAIAAAAGLAAAGQRRDLGGHLRALAFTAAQG